MKHQEYAGRCRPGPLRRPRRGVDRGGRPERARPEHGQTSLMIIGLSIVLLMMVAVVVDASAAYLRRQGLDALADGAALAAADGVQGRQVYERGLGEHAAIDPVAARRYVADYLVATGAAARYPGLTYRVDATTASVVVRVSAPLDLPITPPGWAQDPTVTGTAASYVIVGPG
ncbi:MAG TPA: pilus assembly protein TadG-related protein [Nocardioidaceae bacterium]|nr:pilus assembly protein TadG-related protein [Nocardioidaceae bacterium]